MAARIEAVTSGLPVVAIVGRPNVGKSTLFNRIVKAHRAIVDDAPGVTRDRVVAPARWDEHAFLCVDTGGFTAEEPRDPAAIEAQVRKQALAAVEEADAIVCVLDGHAGLAPADHETVRLLARSGKPVLYAVNKIDHAVREGQVAEFYEAGVETLHPVSAAHGRGMDDLLDAIVAVLPAAHETDAATGEGTRLALMGRPNVGKSSLLNSLLGSERALVAPQAGTTRDATDTAVRIGGRPYVLIDTAGIRRRGRVENALERHGAVRALGTLERTDIVLMVLDATEGMTDQDARLVGRALEAGRGVVLLANKWDAMPAGQRDARAFRRRLLDAHPAFATLPIVALSAQTGEGLESLLGAVRQVERSYRVAMATPVLNRVLRAAVEAHAPPSPGGRPVRFLYATQTGSAPPEVTVFSSAPMKVPPAYTRFLVARFSEAFGVTGVPLRVKLRSRRDAEGAKPRRTPTPARDTAARARRSSKPRAARGRAPRR